MWEEPGTERKLQKRKWTYSTRERAEIGEQSLEFSSVPQSTTGQHCSEEGEKEDSILPGHSRKDPLSWATFCLRVSLS